MVQLKKLGAWIAGVLLAVVLLLWALVQSLVANAIDGTVYDNLIYFFGGPAYLWESSRPAPIAHNMEKLGYLLVSIVLIGLWIAALVVIPLFYMQKRKLHSASAQSVASIQETASPNPTHIAQAELAVAISAIENGSGRSVSQDELDSVHSWMKAFESGIGGLFALQSAEYRCYWLVQTKGGYDFISEQRDLDETDKHIIDHAIKHPSRKNFHDEVYGKYDNSTIYSYFFARNGANFKLAFIIFIHKNNVVTEERKQAFVLATSGFYLLGNVDKLRKIVLDLKKSS
ncbi:hypothetical protein [Paenibacillus koleovorans]|uniref:hypothetical protein n=1 Tax=Paenibacillus koleovorans TaxID=121608 RepID=UPI000FD71CCE|nr:hypothetical protein [Paenibacillus koleovorans]